MATIAENLQRLQTAKNNIANAITVKGGTVASGDGFEEFPTDIANIPKTETPLNYGIRPVSVFARDSWVSKSWSGLTSFAGEYVWTDGENIYYSRSADQYVLDKATSTWSAKTWNAPITNGDRIWSDGTNVYYSQYTDQFVLDKATGTWTAKTWTGLTDYLGYNVWTDGTNIYYSNGSSQYVLTKSTSTWTAKTWSGLTNFSGYFIWTDGTDIYYSKGLDSSGQYILDKVNSIWSAKTWLGSYANWPEYGSRVWTDGENVYYSYDPYQSIRLKPIIKTTKCMPKFN